MKPTFFNFKKSGEKYLITNDLGSYLFLNKSEFHQFVSGNVQPNTHLAEKLLNKYFLYNDSDLNFSSMVSKKMILRKQHLFHATGLHIFVVTTACNLSCVYCQANSKNLTHSSYMNEEIAKRAVNIALQSPERYLSFEFQGGEPLLNFKIIRFIVEYSEAHKGEHVIAYSVVTNITLLTDEMVDFFIAYHISISTSVDGNEYVHNSNRCYKNGRGSFSDMKKSVKKLRDAGVAVGAIETTTKTSLEYAKEIIKAYKELGFSSIFIRPLTPLGKANEDFSQMGYTAEQFLKFYTEVLDELISLNLSGIRMVENHAAIFLKRIFGTYVNYMELRSPCGGGIGQIAYFTDGKIFTCDEARMLYEMGDDAFCIGDVLSSSYSDLIDNGICRTVCSSSLLETIPGCSECVYQPYCGTCPVINYALSKDVIVKSPNTYRCEIYRGILDEIFKRLQTENSDVIKIFKQWGKDESI